MHYLTMHLTKSYNLDPRESNLLVSLKVLHNEISFWLSNPHSANVPGLNHYSTGIVLG